jgi:iron complex outermembrane receptor protein
MNKVFILCGILLIAFAASAQQQQQDSVVHMKSFTFIQNRFNLLNPTLRVQKTDSFTAQLFQANQLSQLLAMNAQIFVRSYGFMQLTGSSMRGAGSEHTAVLWNGISIQNNMLGQLDLSLIQTGIMDEIEINYGGNTALFGSGSVGGTIMLNNQPKPKKNGISVSSGFGSFGLFQYMIQSHYAKGKSYVSIKHWHSEARNDFKFEDFTKTNKPWARLTHANFTHYGLLTEVGTKIGKHSSIDVRYWYQTMDRNLPPTIGTPVRNEFQFDDNHRINAEWNTMLKKLKVTARTAWLYDIIDYRNPDLLINGLGKSSNIVAEVDGIYQYNKYLLLNAGINTTHASAKHESFLRTVERNTQAVFGGFSYTRNLWNVRTSFRQELMNGDILPFTGTITAHVRLMPTIMMGANAGRSYRILTFNELFWPPGNPNLKPEQGWQQELSLHYNKKISKLLFKSDLHVFNRQINNLILWRTFGGFITPVNLNRVHSQGLEWSTQLLLAIKKVIITCRYDLSYTQSINTKVGSLNDASLNKQLVYVPINQHLFWLSVKYKSFYVSYQHGVTGHRFTSSDNRSFLEAYQTGNFFMGRSFVYRNVPVQFQLQVFNIWGENYQVMPARPMPLQHYMLTITIKILTKS